MLSLRDIAILGLGALLPVLIGAIAYYLVQLWRIERTLQAKHRQTFLRLGEPHLFLNNTPRKNIEFLSFLLKRRYRELADPDLNVRCDRCRISFFLVCAIFAAQLIMLGAAVALTN